MGTSKIEHFNADQNEVAKMARALGHPARVAIIQFLLKKNACFCGEIVDELPLSQSTVSQHLKALKSAGLIKGNVEGTAVCYCIDPEAWQSIKKAFFPLFEQFRTCC